jgi:hypothetical protein
VTVSRSIGTLKEQSLHAALKQWLAVPGDLFEQKVGSYHIDILRGETLIEIQTSSFYKLRKKLTKLLQEHKVLLIHPIPITKWVIRTTKRKRQISRRMSPKHGRLEHIFDELLYIPDIATHPNFSLAILLTEQEEIWRDDGKGSWRRKHWSVADKVLIKVIDQAVLHNRDDYFDLIPSSIGARFTHKQLAEALDVPVWLSNRMSYCLRKMGILEVVGKQGRSLVLARAKPVDKIV